jgi:heat shock protein HslJ
MISSGLFSRGIDIAASGLKSHMKKLMIVLPLAFLLACSGPNNTQTTESEMDATTLSASTTTTTDDLATTSTDVTDVNTNVTTVTTDNSSIAAETAISPIPSDTTDPMYQHWQRTNAHSWTWDLNYPGYNRPLAGTYNAAVNGNWQLVMTPELVSAWKKDNSVALWRSRSLTGNTYISASESFNTTNGLNTNTSGGTLADVNSVNYNAANGNLYQVPRFNLFLDNGTFVGYTGCNNISGRVEVTGTGLRFLNTTPSSAVECMGGLDQSVFLDMLNRIDSYTYVNGELQLMQGNQVLLRFSKNEQGMLK